MKKLLIMLIISTCAMAWRSDEIMRALGMVQAVSAPGGPMQAATARAGKTQHRPMTVDEFQQLSKTDPQAYQKFVSSLQAPEERSAVDKLINFLARGKYE